MRGFCVREVKELDYDRTLNLPQTDFPMKAQLPQKEPIIQQFWDEIDIYRLVQEKNAGQQKFILHDGPPYANGHIHLGTALNKILKDIVVKYRSQAGFDAPFVPGWDTHGLPIEQQAIKDLNINRKEIDIADFRQRCREYALRFVDIQRSEFRRLGVRGEWDQPYLTLDPHFEAIQIGVFGEMAKKGYIYKGLKPVYWCTSCETALAEAEIEYADKRSHSVYVAFPIKTAPPGVAAENLSILIWTTTPWTLPANLAVSVNPHFKYAIVAANGRRWIMAQELVDQVMSQLGVTEYAIEQNLTGAELNGAVSRHPFFDRDSVIITGEHVTLDQGTGCVHTAPGHGQEDFAVGQVYKLGVISPVNEVGVFNSEAGKFEGMYYEKANNEIIQDMKDSGQLLYQETITHQYPHCWRCKRPVIFRATEQWFASIDGFRAQALEQIDQVRWIPAWGRDRIYNMVADRGDWCISRQRVWGVPIPIFYCDACQTVVINDETIQHVQKVFREHGSDAWYSWQINDLLPEGYACPQCGANNFRRETDTMDVWFDSGSSHFAVLETRPELAWPADLYLEGSDQHRGWFNSSLSTSVAVRGLAPYRAVLTHGYVVDEKGRKMSKSLGNVVNPLEVIQELGADILRLWVSSSDYRNDIAVSKNILKQVTEAYRKIRNTCRFILGSLSDYEPERQVIAENDLQEIDRWALMKLQHLIKRVSTAYENYDLHLVYHSIHNFCVIDMSAFYLDIIKDRLYVSAPDDSDRRAAQSVLYEIIRALIRLLSPVLTYTSEEIWKHMPDRDRQPISVQLAGWPQIDEQYIDPQLENRWERLIELRSGVSKALEIARQGKLIGHSLGAQVDLYPDADWYQLLQQIKVKLADIFIVSEVVVHLPEQEITPDLLYLDYLPGVGIAVSPATGSKCPRCWQYRPIVSRNDSYPEVCNRCAEVLAKLER